MPFFGKNTKPIVHGFVKKWGFSIGNGIESFYVRMYVYMSCNYTLKIRAIACLVFLKLWICMYMYMAIAVCIIHCTVLTINRKCTCA